MKNGKHVQTPRIILGNGKGGVGKTTASILSALAFAHANFRVGVRDTDSQSSFANALVSNVFDGLGVLEAPLGSENTYDVLLIDGPPSVDAPQFLSEFDSCDLFCLVTGTGTLELLTTAKTYAVLHARRPELPIVLLVNRYAPQLRLDRDFEENLKHVDLAGVPRLKHALQDRELYRYVVFAGWNGAEKIYKDRHRYRRDEFDSAKTETAAVAMELYGLAKNRKA